MRLLRKMRQSLQDGCGRDENAQPYRVHPLRDVHPRLSDERRVLPLRLRQTERKQKQTRKKTTIGGIKMNRKRIFALAFAVLMVLSLAACGTKRQRQDGDMSGNGSAMTGEPKTAEEALALHKELLERENAHPVGKYRAVGKGLYGGRQGHGHDRGREKLRRLPAGHR